MNMETVHFDNEWIQDATEFYMQEHKTPLCWLPFSIEGGMETELVRIYNLRHGTDYHTADVFGGRKSTRAFVERYGNVRHGNYARETVRNMFSDLTVGVREDGNGHLVILSTELGE